MSSASLANDSQGFNKEGRAPVLMSSFSLSPDHSYCYTSSMAPPPAPPLPVVSPAERKRRVRSFNWKPISEERVKQQHGPNLWSRSEGETFNIDVRAIEELFGHKDTASPTVTGGRIGQGRPLVKELRQQISILDSKRSLNIAIFLKHFRKPMEHLLDDILHGNTGVLSVESLRELLKLLPEEDEVKRLQMFSGNPKDLAPPDAFIHRLIHLPRYKVRLEALLLKEEFLPSYTVLKHDMSIILTAVRELLNCEELHSILHLVLEAGNIMNAGGSAGNAVGFKLSSLLPLVDTKANKPGMNLLHFVALEAQKKDLLMFPDKLLHVQQASRVCVDSIRMELHSLTRRVHQLQHNIQTDEELRTKMQAFLKSTDEALKDLMISVDELQTEGDALIDFFCEDKDTFKLDECLRIFQNFCSKFRKAVRENVERGMWAESRHKRLKDSEDKRHSWAGHEGMGGAFKMRSNSEVTVEAELKRKQLLELLHSPLLHMGSGRRSLQQKKSLTSELSCGTETHALPPIHSLSIADAVLPSSAGTQGHINESASHPTPHSEHDSVPRSDLDNSTTTEEPVDQNKTLSIPESQIDELQMTPAVTSDPSQKEDAHSEFTNTPADDLQLRSQHQETHGGVTPSANSKPPPATKTRPSLSVKLPSSSTRPSSFKHVSASQSNMRKILPLRQPGPAAQIQEHHIRPVLSNARKTPVLRTAPREKICRASPGVLKQPSPLTSARDSTIIPPSFTRNTMASTTRSTGSPLAPKAPALTRTPALRIPHGLKRETPAGNARLPPPAGHQRKNSSTTSENSLVNRGSSDKTVIPVWR